MQPFESFELDPLILKALEKMQFKEPSPIQKETIPLIQQNKDLIALAQTGSGKTAACAIPICNRVNTSVPHVQALIVVPTRELAMQYASEVQKIGHYKGVKAYALFGGEDYSLQESKLKHGVQVLVATPGRLIDLIYSRRIDLTHANTLVLDEADEMLSMGFYDDLEFIIQCLIHEHQTLLFSATMPKQIQHIAKRHMKDPVEITLISKDAGPSSIEHQFLYCRHDQREAALLKLMQDMQPTKGIIFCHSRIECEKVCRALQKTYEGIDYLHAGLGQELRTIITGKFRSGKVKFLVATDVASRGLDISGVTHVFIYHLGDDPDVYVHRSGRTGRFEKAGTVVTLVTDKELSTFRNILHLIKREPIWIGSPPPEKKERPKGPPKRRYYKNKK